MLKVECKRHFCLYTLFFLIVLCGGSERVYGAQLFVNEDWQYQEDDDGDFLETTRQSYSANLEQQMTEILTLRQTFRYGKDWEEHELHRETKTGNAGLTLKNDLFFLNLDGSYNETSRDDSDDLIATTWESALESGWKKNFVPDLRTSFGQTRERDDREPHRQDEIRSFSDSVFEWDLKEFLVYYNYRWNNRESNVTNADETSDQHLARFETNQVFWNNRIRMSFTQQYSLENDDRGGIAAGDIIVVNVAETLAGLDDTPEDGTLAIFNGLNNNILDDTDALGALSATANKPWLDPPAGVGPLNMAVRVNSQAVDRLRIYTPVDLSPSGINEEANINGWEIYTSNDGVNWNQVITPFTVQSYDTVTRSYRIVFTDVLIATYIKVVVNYSGIDDRVTFSEMDALFNLASVPASVTPSNIETQRTNYKTDLGLGLQITRSTDFRYNGLYEKEIVDDNYSGTAERLQEDLSHSGTFTWRPSPFLSTSLRGNQYWQKEEVEQVREFQSMSRSYGVDIDGEPLETVAMSLGITFTDTYRDQLNGDFVTAELVKTTETSQYNFETTARLYPDLESRFDITFTETERLDSNLETEVLNSSLTLTARLHPDLTTIVTGGYTEQRTSTETNDIYTGQCNLNWRPSDLFSLNVTGQQSWSDADQDSRSLSTSILSEPTPKTDLRLIYSLSEAAGTTIEAGSAILRWDLATYLFLEGTGDYQKSEADTVFRVGLRANLRFSTY